MNKYLNNNRVNVWTGAIDMIDIDLADMGVEFEEGEIGYFSNVQNSFFELMLSKHDFNPEEHTAYLLKATFKESVHYVFNTIVNNDPDLARTKMIEYYTQSYKGWEESCTGGNCWALTKRLDEDNEMVAFISNDDNEIPRSPVEKCHASIMFDCCDDTCATFDTLYEAEKWVADSWKKILTDFKKANQQIAIQNVLDKLSDSYKEWCNLEGLPFISMDELIAYGNEITEKQHTTVKAFYELWMELDS